jgi:hypothetical protein
METGLSIWGPHPLQRRPLSRVSEVRGPPRLRRGGGAGPGELHYFRGRQLAWGLACPADCLPVAGKTHSLKINTLLLHRSDHADNTCMTNVKDLTSQSAGFIVAPQGALTAAPE